MKFKFLLLSFGLVFISVVTTYIATRTTAQQAQPVPAANEYQVGAVLWVQTSAENRALAHQAFNIAKLRLEQNRKKCKKKKTPCAVVVDVDETVLDNSPNQAWQIINRRTFNQADWFDWVKREEAKPIPGAVEFLQEANRRNVRVFYVTNRLEEERTATVNNLRKIGFPDVSNETLLLRADVSSKEVRRQTISAKHRIIMLIGDNLNDLAQVFERKSIADRFAAVDQLKNEFGDRFIVLPNPMYGEWEGAVYEYNFRRSEEEKSAARRNALRAY